MPYKKKRRILARKEATTAHTPAPTSDHVESEPDLNGPDLSSAQASDYEDVEELDQRMDRQSSPGIPTQQLLHGFQSLARERGDKILFLEQQLRLAQKNVEVKDRALSEQAHSYNHSPPNDLTPREEGGGDTQHSGSAWGGLRGGPVSTSTPAYAPTGDNRRQQ